LGLWVDVAVAAFDRALLDEERGDLKAAAQQWDAYAAAYANPTVPTLNPPNICFVAVIYEKTGQPAKGECRPHCRRQTHVRRLLPVPRRLCGNCSHRIDRFTR
jgi:hypothetical protein